MGYPTTVGMNWTDLDLLSVDSFDSAFDGTSLFPATTNISTSADETFWRLNSNGFPSQQPALTRLEGPTAQEEDLVENHPSSNGNKTQASLEPSSSPNMLSHTGAEISTDITNQCASIAPHLANVRDQGEPLPALPTPAMTESYDRTAHPSPSAKEDSLAIHKDLENANALRNESWIEKLAEINIKLFKHANTVSASCCISGTTENVKSACGSQIMKGNRNIQNAPEREGFAIDMTFELSRELLAIFTEISQSCRHFRDLPQAENFATNKDTGMRSPGSNTQQSSASGNLWSRDHGMALSYDTGSTLLVLSSYVRMLDLYNRFFALISTSLLTSSEQDPSSQVRLPSLSVGCFSLQSSPALQTTLMLRIIEEVFERLRLVMSRMDFLSPSPHINSNDVEDDVGPEQVGITGATIQAVRQQETKVMKRMNDLRKQLQRSVIV